MNFTQACLYEPCTSWAICFVVFSHSCLAYLQVDSHRKQKPTVIPYIDKKQRAPQEKPDVLPDIERMEHYDPTGIYIVVPL